MAMTNREVQAAYRARYYAAGYKQMRIWVPRESVGKEARLTRELFTRAMEWITAGWGVERLARFYDEVLEVIMKEGYSRVE